MRSLAILFVLIFAPLAAQASYAVKIAKHESINAYYIEDNSLPVISIKLAFKRSGYAYDPKGKGGLAYLVAGMLNEGAGHLTSEKFQKLLEENAIQFYPSVDADNFYIDIKTISQNLDLTLELLHTALARPHFNAGELKTVKAQVASIINKREESPGQFAGLKFGEEFFGEHPYAQPEEGNLAEVAKLKPSDLRKYVKQNFIGDNVVVSIAGDVKEKAVDDILSQIYTALGGGKAAFEIRDFITYPDAGHGAGRKDFALKNPQAVIFYGLKGVQRSDEDFYAAYVLAHILGGSGFQSRLYKEIREDRGLAYYTYVGLRNYDKAGLFIGNVGTTSAQADQVVEIVKQEIANLAEKGVTEEELAAAQSYITGSFPLNLDKNSKLAEYLLVMQLEDLGTDYLRKRNGYFNSVTLEQINALAKKLLKPEDALFVVVGE